MKRVDPVRVLVVDDQQVIRNGLTQIISGESDMEVVGEAENGRQALSVAAETRPQIVIMDLSMPEMGGLEAMIEIRKSQPKVRFIVFSVFKGEEDIHRALEAGASGYLFKVVQGNELIAAIRMVSAGRPYLPLQVAERLRFRHPADQLTARELDVLSGVASGRTNRLIGENLGISEGTVKAHVNKILTKLGAKDRTQAVVFGFERGIIHLEGEE
jgi:two-component system NarL family response regulator